MCDDEAKDLDDAEVSDNGSRLGPYYNPVFAPRHQHRLDLAWYFERGPKPKGLTRKQRERYGRIHRCLNGGGYHLRLALMNPGDFAVPLAGAFDPRYDRTPYEVWEARLPWDEGELRRLAWCRAGLVSDPSDWLLDAALETALANVEREYAEYVEAATRHYGVRPERFVVLSRDALVRAIWAGPLRRGKFVTVEQRGRLKQEKQDTVHPDDALHRLIDARAIGPATWGDWRVGEDAAIRITGIGLGATVRQGTDGAFERLRELARLFPRKARAPDTKHPLSNREVAQAARLFHAVSGAVPGDLVELSKAQRRRPPPVGRDTTTVTELSAMYGVPSGRLRELLVAHGCEEARVRNSQIPCLWLMTEDGKRFREACKRVAGSFSERVRQSLKARKYDGSGHRSASKS